jgi:pyruvate dehydrogenase E1 component alpha subunit
MTAEELLAFEADIASEFEAGHIAAPVHLAGGNEMQLIEFFKGIADQDYIACSWRSHYHALLKGVPPAVVKAAIMDGRSIALCFPHYRMVSSAIVGGICPIAMGIAWAIKRQGGDAKVWCFIGDMTATSGIFAETVRYAMQNALPIMFVIEDNGMSVCTPTRAVWGTEQPQSVLTGYAYELTRPHVGTGKFVRF